MSQNTAGITASAPVHECDVMPDWEAEILGIPREDHAQLVLKAKRGCGNAHPQEMFDRNPTTSVVVGLVFVEPLDYEDYDDAGAAAIDSRDVLIGGREHRYHVTWRATDQYLPRRATMFPAGLVVLRADGRKQFQAFKWLWSDDIPLNNIARYVEGLPSTNY